MGNKYSLGITKVASEHHLSDTGHLKVMECRNCHSSRLVFDPRKTDHRCESCGEWQKDLLVAYYTGRSAEY